MRKFQTSGRTMAALLCSAAMAVPIWSAPSMAQGAGGEGSNGNEIIVTAQRRSEALEDVPMSVSVVTSDTLAKSGVTNLRELSNVTSGYQLASGGAFPQPAIRGITNLLNGTFENNVAIYVDGLYQPQAASLNVDLPNIDNVQILKGPQGSLYGRNATGGAILISTISPGVAWQGKVEATYASFDDKRGSAYIAGPLTERVGISLAGYVRRSDGYVKAASRTTPGVSTRGQYPIRQDAIRAKIVAELSDSLKATLAYSYTKVDDPSSSVYAKLENVSSTYLRPGAATRPTELGVGAYDITTGLISKQHEGGLTLELDTGIGKLRSITGYSKDETLSTVDFDGSYLPDGLGVASLRNRTFQQTVDFAIDAISKVDLVIGANYYHDRLDFPKGSVQYSGLPANANNPGTVPGTLADYFVAFTGNFDQKRKAWAVYGDLTFHATDRLSVTAGGRYSEEKQDVVASQTSAIASLARNPTSTSATFRKFTPRASIRYELGARTNVYFTFAQGFRSGSFNNALPICVNTLGAACYLPAKQESVDSFEVGFKTAGSNFHLDLAAFLYNYKDLQVSATRSITVGNTTFPLVDITSAPKARIYGVEGSFDYEPIENLTINGSASWLHARFGDNFLFGGVGVASSGPGGGIGINTNADPLKTYLNVNQTQDLSGLQMARAPDFSASLGFSYNVPKGDGGLLFAANVKYTSSYVATNPSIWGSVLTATQMAQAGVGQNNTNGVPADRLREQRFRQSGYALLSASITWTDPSNHYYARVWGSNLTDQRYRLHYTGSTAGTYAPMATPRTVGGTIGYKF